MELITSTGRGHFSSTRSERWIQIHAHACTHANENAHAHAPTQGNQTADRSECFDTYQVLLRKYKPQLSEVERSPYHDKIRMLQLLLDGLQEVHCLHTIFYLLCSGAGHDRRFEYRLQHVREIRHSVPTSRLVSGVGRVLDRSTGRVDTCKHASPSSLTSCFYCFTVTLSGELCCADASLLRPMISLLLSGHEDGL